MPYSMRCQRRPSPWRAAWIPGSIPSRTPSTIWKADRRRWASSRMFVSAASPWPSSGAMARSGCFPATPGRPARVTTLLLIRCTVSAAAREELYALPTGDSQEIPHGETITLWTSYSDPNDRQVTVGGAAVVTALVGGTHYSANSQADGLGSDLTASISATLEPFASVAKWTLTNNHASSTAYIVPPLKVIGKALRNPGPKTFEATSTQAYGTRPLSLDLKYQADSVIAQSYATFL